MGYFLQQDSLPQSQQQKHTPPPLDLPQDLGSYQDDNEDQWRDEPDEESEDASSLDNETSSSSSDSSYDGSLMSRVVPEERVESNNVEEMEGVPAQQSSELSTMYSGVAVEEVEPPSYFRAASSPKDPSASRSSGVERLASCPSGEKQRSSPSKATLHEQAQSPQQQAQEVPRSPRDAAWTRPRSPSTKKAPLEKRPSRPARTLRNKQDSLAAATATTTAAATITATATALADYAETTTAVSLENPASPVLGVGRSSRRRRQARHTEDASRLTLQEASPLSEQGTKRYWDQQVEFYLMLQST